MKAEIEYIEDADSLSVWTGKPATEGEEIADGIIVDLDADGNVVGFTIEHATVLLYPLLAAVTSPGAKLTTNAESMMESANAIMESISTPEGVPPEGHLPPTPKRSKQRRINNP